MSVERIVEGAALPPRLRDLSRPPRRLYVRGDLPRGPCVAVVGTRHPTAEAVDFTRRLTGDLARAGVAVASGGAKGIDTAAHVGALDAGGSTIVFAPCSFDCPFPPENAELFARVVARGGVYATEHPPGTPAHPSAFFRRNECLVAFAHAVILVESGFRGGGRNAAKQARRLARTLFAVPGAPWNDRALGCIQELQWGARPLGRAKDAIEVLEAQKLRGFPSEFR